MKVTDVRIKLMHPSSNGTQNEQRLRAFCTMTFDECMVVRDMKIAEGNRGTMFVSMPDRRLTDKCGRCRCKNPLTAMFCNRCGENLGGNRARYDETGRLVLYADVVLPISQAFRAVIHEAAMEAYWRKLKAYEQDSSYVSRYSDVDWGEVG